jgi:hypothetical protein
MPLVAREPELNKVPVMSAGATVSWLALRLRLELAKSRYSDDVFDRGRGASLASRTVIETIPLEH